MKPDRSYALTVLCQYLDQEGNEYTVVSEDQGDRTEVRLRRNGVVVAWATQLYPPTGGEVSCPDCDNTGVLTTTVVPGRIEEITGPCPNPVHRVVADKPESI